MSGSIGRMALATAVLCAAIASRQAVAAMKCDTVEKTNYSSQGMPNGWQKIDSTAADGDIQKFCTAKDWNKPLDDWYYGDYDFLFSNWKDRYPTEQDRAKAMASRKPDYVKEIRRYVCVDDKTKAPIGYFAFHLASKTNGELTFLCVPSNNRSKGDGSKLMDAALSEAGAKGGEATINLKIKSLVSAIPFYSSFDMDCSTESQGKVTVTNFSTGNLPMTKRGAGVARRAFSFNENLEGGKPSCKRINYGCTTKDAYDSLEKTAESLLDAGFDNPLSQQSCEGSIDAGTAKKTICDFLKQGSYDKIQEVGAVMTANCK